MENHNDTQTGIISWFARNSVSRQPIDDFYRHHGYSELFHHSASDVSKH